MSNEKLQLLSPLFLRYQSDYEKNPRSRVFAPLAEMYRKVGMVEKAMEILVLGIKYNPDYVMGYLGLGFCYYDIKQYKLAYDTIKNLIESHRDNLRLQKLFVDVCMALTFYEEALSTCKYLVFINPRDKESVDNLAILEDKVANLYKHNHNPIIFAEDERQAPRQQTKTSIDIEDEFDAWKPLDFNAQKSEEELEGEIDLDNWNLKKIVPNLNDNHIAEPDHNFRAPTKEIEKIFVDPKIDVIKETKVKAYEIEEERTFVVDFKKEAEEEKPLEKKMADIQPTHKIDISHLDENKKDSSEEKKEAQSAPLITHTLVDLYCGQGHFHKALELLDRILLLNPTDKKTIEKKLEIEEMMFGAQAPSESASAKKLTVLKEEDDNLEDNSIEEEGRNDLMSIIDTQIDVSNLKSLLNEPVEVKEEKPAQTPTKAARPVEDLKKAEESFDKAIANFKKKHKSHEPLKENETTNNLKDNLVSLSQHPEIAKEEAPKEEEKTIANSPAKQKKPEITRSNNEKIKKLNHFLEAIHKRALDYQARF